MPIGHGNWVNSKAVLSRPIRLKYFFHHGPWFPLLIIHWIRGKRGNYQTNCQSQKRMFAGRGIRGRLEAHAGLSSRLVTRLAKYYTVS